MEFLNTNSSIVFVGKNFSPHLFKAVEFSELLGEPDSQSQIVLPVMMHQAFPASGYKVVITPDRLDIGFEGKEPLPRNLKTLADSVAAKLQQFQADECTGIGINLDVVISDQVLTMTGMDYCRHHLNISNLERKLGDYEFFANTLKLIYSLNDINYTVDIEPYFRSKGKDLIVKINAHQDLPNASALNKTLSRYAEIKRYLENFHDKFFGE